MVQNKKNKWVAVLTGVATVLLPILLASILLTSFRFQIAVGSSMVPTVQPGSITLCLKTFFPPQHGDVVLIRVGGRNMLKRVIATQGQLVQVNNTTGTVYLDGTALADPFSAPRKLDYAQEAWPGGYTGEAVFVPDGHVFCMGDNRADSLDSRDARIGFVPVENVWGKLIYVFPVKEE